MSITLHDLILTGFLPPFQQGETLDSYARRVYRAGIIAGVSYGVGMVAPIQPVIIQQREPVLSDPETFADKADEGPRDGGVEDDADDLGGNDDEDEDWAGV